MVKSLAGFNMGSWQDLDSERSEIHNFDDFLRSLIDILPLHFKFCINILCLILNPCSLCMQVMELLICHLETNVPRDTTFLSTLIGLIPNLTSQKKGKGTWFWRYHCISQGIGTPRWEKVTPTCMSQKDHHHQLILHPENFKKKCCRVISATRDGHGCIMKIFCFTGHH